MKDFSKHWKQWKRGRHAVACGGRGIERGVRHRHLKQLRNGRCAVADAGRVIEPGANCSLYRRQRRDNNRIERVVGHVELLRLHRREGHDNSRIDSSAPIKLTGLDKAKFNHFLFMVRQ